MRSLHLISAKCILLVAFIPAVPAAAQEKNLKLGARVDVEWKSDLYRPDESVNPARILPVGGTQMPTPQATPTPAADSVFSQILDLLKQSQEKQTAGELDEAIALDNRALELAEKN